MKYVICNSSAVTLKFVAFRAKKHGVLLVLQMYALCGGRHYIFCLVDVIISFVWFVYILPLEMTLKKGSGNVPLLESDW